MYYAVHKGHKPGIYVSWQDCKKQVDKFDGAIFKKFSNKEEAQQFLQIGFGEGKKPRSVVRKENDDQRNKDAIDNETEDDENCVFIYTDGSCIRFKTGISKAGYGIYIPEKSIKVSAPLLNQKITNNRAELTAIIESIKYLDENELNDKKICIFTDSQYSMYIYNGTGERYEKNGFKNDSNVDVPNIDLIKKILEIKRKYPNIVLLKVRAHTSKKDRHSLGNEMADKLATSGALESNEENKKFFSSEYNHISKSNSEDHIDKNIQINELFDFDEKLILEEDINKEVKSVKPIKKDTKTKKTSGLKSSKLSEWFVKS
jgi:ribonuclease HI